MDSEAVSIIRELGKKAVWVGVGFFDEAAAQLTAEYSMYRMQRSLTKQTCRTPQVKLWRKAGRKPWTYRPLHEGRRTPTARMWNRMSWNIVRGETHRARL